MSRFLLIALLIGLNIPADGRQPPAASRLNYGLDSLSRKTLDEALKIQGMSEPELGFYKFWAVDSFFRLKVVDRLLSHPLEVLPYVESVAGAVDKAQRLPVNLILGRFQAIDVPIGWQDTLRLLREIKRELGKKGTEVNEEGFDTLPLVLGSALNTILAGFEVGNRYLSQALAKIPERELDILLGEAPNFWKDEDDSLEKGYTGILHREFGKDYDTSKEVKSETLLAYARKIDRRYLALSGLAVVIACGRAVEELKSFKVKECQSLKLEGVKGSVLYATETKWGEVIIGGPDDNIYERDAALIIDLGGNDIYYNRAGGAIGVLDQPFSIVLDIKGNDHYNSSKLFSQGSALFGTGVLFDMEGDDVYRGKHYTQGAAIFGTGIFWDFTGNDLYDAGFFAQGAGHYGIGVLIDNEGNDTYRSFCYCQGFAGTWGYGLLAEGRGNDLYYAGGKYKHEPLLPREYRSFSQGFAIGVRPDAGGGIGFLCDFQGNDFYNAEVFCQGTSYWYSLGMLYDQEGFDHYTAA
ncbi:MAG: hypothetical protein ABIK39_06690, partial [candidate division WOR-3 bacterium]